MGIFDQLGGGGRQRLPQMNPMQMLGQLRQDPVGILRQAGFNIPAGMSSPQQMVNYLLQSGQVGQGRVNQAMQQAGLKR